MRWSEIINEQQGIVDMARSYIMDIIAPLRARGLGSITVQQLIDQLKRSPDFEGTQIEGDLVNQALDGVQDIKVEADPQNGQLSVIWNDPTAGRQVDRKQAEKDDKAIHSAAMRTIDKKES